MNRFYAVLGASLLSLLPGMNGQAAASETGIVESSIEVIQDFTAMRFKAIPPALLEEAQGIAIIPNVLKAGFVFGGRFGRGVVLTREPDGTWSYPVFITLAGGGVGWQIGVQSTDLVLLFRTRNGLDRILKGRGKLTLGADISVAAGPVGRQASAATDGQLKAEIYSYSRTRGLFAGLSVEGAGMVNDFDANEVFYHLPGGRPADLAAQKGMPIPLVAENLRQIVARLSIPAAAPPALPPPAVIQGPPIAVPPPPPVAPPSPVSPAPPE